MCSLDETVRRKHEKNVITVFHSIMAQDCPELEMSSDDPTNYTFKQAMNHPTEGHLWKQSMDDERNSWLVNDIWEMVECPKEHKPISCRWLYKKKYDKDGNVTRHKSRLVARGFKQKAGIDYNETFAPVAKFTTFRLVFAIAATMGWKIHQMDAKTAFLCSEIDTLVYIEVPEGTEVPEGFQRPAMRLKKGLYGLKQSPRLWYKRLSSYLVKIGFVQSNYDHSLFMRQGAIVVIYVDDALITGQSEEVINEIKDQLNQEFEMTDSGEVAYFLGLEVESVDGGYVLKQTCYIQKILEDYAMTDCKPVSTPIEALFKRKAPGDKQCSVSTSRYMAAVGSLMYLAQATRPDIAFAVAHLSQFCSNPAEHHWIAVKRVFRYLKGTQHHGLWLVPGRQDKVKSQITKKAAKLVGYSDSDWASDHIDRKSTGGYEFMFDGCLISWASRKQTFVATSTMEAEYVAASTAAKEAIWLMNITDEINKHAVQFCENDQNRLAQILSDNQAAIKVAKNPEDHKRSKHIDISFHFVRQRVELGHIEMQYINTNEMAADYLTKPLNPAKFVRCRNKSGIYSTIRD